MAQPTPAPAQTPEQHPLARSVLLHLFPGAALALFVLVAAPAVEDWGFPAVFALLAGIGLVIVPLELGYLLWAGRRASGRWSIWPVIDYRAPLPRRWGLIAAGLVVWFIVLLALTTALLDEAIAESVFGWMPETLRQFSRFEEEGDPSYAGWKVALMIVVAFAFNGIAGPVTEELYFRGHLLPRIDRYGRGAPVVNAVLFSLYHLWTPWQNPMRILALLPWIHTVWRTRSLRLSIVVHVAVNTIFLLGLLLAFL